MDLSERLKMIIIEKKLKQVIFAESLGISQNYISLLTNGKKTNISKALAKLIEETYGYSSEWIMTGEGDKYISNDLSSIKLDTIKKVKKMSDEEVTALLAFMDSLDTVRETYRNQKESP